MHRGMFRTFTRGRRPLLGLGPLRMDLRSIFVRLARDSETTRRCTRGTGGGRARSVGSTNSLWGEDALLFSICNKVHIYYVSCYVCEGLLCNVWPSDQVSVLFLCTFECASHVCHESSTSRSTRFFEETWGWSESTTSSDSNRSIRNYT